MKNTNKFKTILRIVGIIAVIAVIGFSMAACGGEDDNPIPGPNPTGSNPTGSNPASTPSYALVTMKFIESDGWNEAGHDEWARWYYEYQDTNNLFDLSGMYNNKVYIFTYSFSSDIDIDNLGIYFIDSHDNNDGTWHWEQLSDHTRIGVIGDNIIKKNTTYSGKVALIPNSASSNCLPANIFLCLNVRNRNVNTPATLYFSQFSFEKVNKEVSLDKWTVSGKDFTIKLGAFAEKGTFFNKTDVLRVKPPYYSTMYSDNVMEYDLITNYAGKKIEIVMSMDVYLTKPGRIAWQIDSPDPYYPVVCGIVEPNSHFPYHSGPEFPINKWYTISGSNIITVPSSVNGTNNSGNKLYLSGMQIDGAEAYFANATLTITEVPVSNTAVTLNSVTANGSDSQTTTQLTLNFNQAITGLTADNIIISGNVSGVTKGTLSGSGSTYTLPISGFTKGGNLTVWLTKSGYNITPSKTVTIYVYNSTPMPSAPTGLITTGATSNSITISWNPVSGATGYYVYRSLTYSGTYTLRGTVTTTSYTDTGLSAGTTYYYKVAAYITAGTGSQSPVIMAATVDNSTLYISISGTARIGQKLTAVSNGSGWIGNITWGYAPSANSSTFYKITSGVSGINGNELTIPANYAGYYIRAFRDHNQGTWKNNYTGYKCFPSNYLGPVQ
jgi:hypothetical protein